MSFQNSKVSLCDVCMHIDDALIHKDTDQVKVIAEVINNILEKDDAEKAIFHFEEVFRKMYGTRGFEKMYEDFMMACKGRPTYQIDIMNGARQDL